MVVLTDEMKEALKVVGKGGTVVYLATANVEGKPNLVGMRFVSHYKDEFIIIADMYFVKTKANLRENPNSAVAMAHPLKGREWVFRGESFYFAIGLLTENPDFEWHGIRAGDLLKEWGNWGEKEPPDEVPPDIRPPALQQRGVYCLHVKEVYSLKPGEVGKRIL
ncbi:pyridoxamine 5'-phosphate oxidase family protein [Candidatus Bathyarchaeota archaeon]|nr:pyridoxamine 5'-phosphate oxidase family protein [Candidatus Bathyarchaeota archaeon]